MAWTAPKIEIHSFVRKTLAYQHEKGELQCFEGTVTEFDVDPNESKFIFVHATDLCEGLNPWDIIPCQDVEVIDSKGEGGLRHQKLRVWASLHQRAPGWYHLIGWRDIDPDDRPHINNACVYEYALRILAPDPEVEKALREGEPAKDGGGSGDAGADEG